jgi:hypothetical protein
MGYQFNPLTGKLDLVGSGGGGGATLGANTFTDGQTITASANTSALTASYSVTGANTTPLLDLSGTWNTTGVARGILLNITDTASAATSCLLDLQTSGTSRFSVDKKCLARFTGDGTNPALYFSTANTGFRFSSSGLSYQVSGLNFFNCSNSSQFRLRSDGSFCFTNGNDAQGTIDTILARDAANTLALRNGTNAQAFRLYNTFTDINNGRRLDITSTTGGVFTLTATGNGTGASGNVLKLTAPVMIPAASVTLATNGDLAFEATSNTSLTIRYRGSDGTTRSASLTLS